MNRKQRRAAATDRKTDLKSTRRLSVAHGLQKSEPFFEIAFRHFQSGNTAEAEKLCHAICVANPNHAGATHVLGLIAHQKGFANDAISLLRRAVTLNARFAPASNNLGVVLCQIGKLDEGIACYQRAVALDPNYAAAHSNLAGAYIDDNRPDEAVAQCRTALRLNPVHAEAHYNLGSAYYRLGRSDEAIAHFERALEINQKYTTARFALCMAELPIIFANEAEIELRRARYEQRLDGLIDSEWGQLGDLAEAVGVAQPFQLAYQGYDDRTLQSRYGTFICRVMENRYPPVKLAAPAAAGEMVRVGFVSGYFRKHSNWKIPLKGWISQLDRQRFKILGYHTGLAQDEQTELAAAMCDRFVKGPLSIDGWREAIAADAPHVLIYPEVGMNPVAVKLAAQRLAAVQCGSWGHPETSGLPTMDYYLSSELMEPPEASAHYTEKLVRLPNLSVYYEPLTTTFTPTSRSEHGLPQSAPIFWCGQSLFKYLPQFDCVFPRIAREVPDCQFVFIHFPAGSHIKALFRQRLDRAFRNYGLDFEKYCVIRPQLDPGSFAALLGQCDIVLDSIGWSGCNSTLESLQFDLPIVTMPGQLMRSRHTQAILTMMGVKTTVASNLDEYVAIAARLANDPDWRAEIKGTIAQKKHVVYRDHTCISALEDFLLRVSQQPEALN